MAKKQPPDDVSIGKFDILATYTYAHAPLSGWVEGEAKQRGMVAAVMGATTSNPHRKKRVERTTPGVIPCNSRHLRPQPPAPPQSPSFGAVGDEA